MTIYFPKSVLELPLIKKAAEMLNAHSEEYDIPKLDLKESIILDPVRNFLSMYFLENDENREEKINYLAQTFYSVKGTCKVIQFLYLYGLIDSRNCNVVYRSSKRLEITLDGTINTWPRYYWINEETGERGTEVNSIDYCSVEYINKLREFLKALLYFGNLDIYLKSLVVDIPLQNHGGVFGDVELFIIEKEND